ncbi:hypothetical protein BS618_32765 [Rhodococcus erythropolis]|nr:hypothetical protein BS618_32765 [Rhodococcus erythropolis]
MCLIDVRWTEMRERWRELPVDRLVRVDAPVFGRSTSHRTLLPVLSFELLFGNTCVLEEPP